MARIIIPSTIKEAAATLGDLDDLVTAKEWHRAAIVYAFTEAAQGRRTDLARKGARFTIAEFAKLGIHGLRKRDTVAAYQQAWRQAIADGHATEVAPGARVEH